MSDSSNCGKGCKPGIKQSNTCLPNLVSPAEMRAGVRDCSGKKPFNVPWCHRKDGYPPGSMVYTKCGYFFNVVRAYGDPRRADSEWIEFDFAFMFDKLLDSMTCESCPSLTDGVKPWIIDGECVNVAMAGETWCFPTTDDDGNVTYVFACATEDDVIKPPSEKPESWTDTKTPDQMVCSLLQPVVDKHVTGVSISGDTITTTMGDGTTHVVTVSHPTIPDDVHVSNFSIEGDVATVTLSDGSTFTDNIIHPPATVDKHIVDAVIQNGNITYTYNDGSTLVRPHPEAEVTTASSTVAGTCGGAKITTSDGVETSFEFDKYVTTAVEPPTNTSENGNFAANNASTWTPEGAAMNWSDADLVALGKKPCHNYVEL